MTEVQTASCTATTKHPPHDWRWTQVDGGYRVFDYHCPGIKNMVIETWEDA